MLFPTLEEGFGFPLLEARTFGAPVIASTDPALVEVSAGSDAVTHVDASDRVAWLRRDHAAADVPRRAATRRRSHRRTRSTWDENAAMVVALYRTLIRT